MEIALLPMVESGFNPKALSSSNASGIWQFIPETGRDFGLNQNHWMDERRDIKAATNAALTYLQHLHSDLGNWYLALAAYNCGEGLVNQLIAQQRARNLPTDYLSLPLPAQTKNYVPKLLAVRDIIKHPEKYGLETDFIPNKAYFKSVELNEPLDVYQAARLAKISINEFRALNPAYTHSFIPKASGAILLPVNQVAIFKENIKNYDNPLKDWGKYFTRPGEPLIRVALQTGTTVQMIARVNGLPNNAYFRFRNRQVVLTPPLRKTYVARYHSGDYTYKVRPGDTMYGIAKAHDINLQRLIALNEGRTHLSLGETIHLPYFSHTKGLYRSGQHN
ncbi:MAG: transglycosylase SLT domain-containing protein, partial [Pseudomonadota bacterium]|nr:transglycosylase SLT domain-containing protein [Pseudomonadota bacterium]